MQGQLLQSCNLPPWGNFFFFFDFLIYFLVFLILSEGAAIRSVLLTCYHVIILCAASEQSLTVHRLIQRSGLFFCFFFCDVFV